MNMCVCVWQRNRSRFIIGHIWWMWRNNMHTFEMRVERKITRETAIERPHSSVDGVVQPFVYCYLLQKKKPSHLDQVKWNEMNWKGHGYWNGHKHIHKPAKKMMCDVSLVKGDPLRLRRLGRSLQENVIMNVIVESTQARTHIWTVQSEQKGVFVYVCACAPVFVSGFGRKTDDKRLSVWFRLFSFSLLFTVFFVHSLEILAMTTMTAKTTTTKTTTTAYLTCPETIFTQLSNQRVWEMQSIDFGNFTRRKRNYKQKSNSFPTEIRWNICVRARAKVQKQREREINRVQTNKSAAIIDACEWLMWAQTCINNN